MKNAVYILVFLTLFTSCRSYSYINDYSVSGPEFKLPTLTPVSEQENFIIHRMNSDETTFNEYTGPEIGTLTLTKQFDKFVQSNLTSNLGKPYGQAVLHIDYLNCGINNYGYVALNTVLVFIPSLLGVPVFKTFCELDIRVDIIDSNNTKLASYTSKQRDKAKIGLYNGYSTTTGMDKVLLESIEKAFTDILYQISKNEPYLSNSLLKAGEIK